MENKARLRISRLHYDLLMQHLFPGDNEEHGAVILAGIKKKNNQITLLVKEVHLANEGTDYVAGKIGHRALTPAFIHKLITRARDRNLVYLAIHNHFSDKSVSFSRVDMESHERGYPALLQINRGTPVGALVFGRNSMQMDLWLSQDVRLELEHATIVGSTITRLTPRLEKLDGIQQEIYDRQIRMFGALGQKFLKECRVAIVGLGGVGSILAEYLARLGIQNFYLIDDDRIEASNFSRIVGAESGDIQENLLKVLIAKRNILRANPDANIECIADDVSKKNVAALLSDCDYIFLAADSMRARLVVNAVVHQYLIPAVQLGAKIRSNKETGVIIEAMSAKRPIRPGRGCLWCNQFIDPHQLAIEAKSDAERKEQAYGVEEPNPSVITLNSISAGHAANDFLLDYLSIRQERELAFEHYHFLNDKRTLVLPRKDVDCPECGESESRYACGDLLDLPTSD